MFDKINTYFNYEHEKFKLENIHPVKEYGDLLYLFHKLFQKNGDVDLSKLTFKDLDCFIGYNKYTLFSSFTKLHQVKYFMEKGYDINKNIYINGINLDLTEDTYFINQIVVYIYKNNFECFNYLVDYVDMNGLKQIILLLNQSKNQKFIKYKRICKIVYFQKYFLLKQIAITPLAKYIGNF